MDVAVVVGNPKPASRTLAAAALVARRLRPDVVPTVIDLVTYGTRLLGSGDPSVAHAVRTVAASELAVFASPTFKATYTGLLKLFLEQFDADTGLAGVVAVPVMLGAGPTHALAPDLLLKPVLAELGATCALPGLYLSDKRFHEDGAIDRYAARWRDTVAALTAARPAPAGPPQPHIGSGGPLLHADVSSGPPLPLQRDGAEVSNG
ncbi:NADPH-dependent oxidoreductase [Skermania sp. ID1734]|nr:NADPH-dependent oxidoreductase [Skermania sp. ID1734]